jgi:hypothetical protein
VVPGTGLLEFGARFRSLTATTLHVTGYPAMGVPAWFGIAERVTGASERGAKRHSDSIPGSHRCRAHSRTRGSGC